MWTQWHFITTHDHTFLKTYIPCKNSKYKVRIMQHSL